MFPKLYCHKNDHYEENDKGSNPPLTGYDLRKENYEGSNQVLDGDF